MPSIHERLDDIEKDIQRMSGILEHLCNEIAAIETIECPGCGKEVRVHRGQKLAQCRDCSLTAEVKWHWDKPVNGDEGEGQ